MARVNVTDVEGFLNDETLDRGLYTVEVVEAQILQTKRGFDQLLLRMVVEDGPAQMNGASPAGTEVSDFILLDEGASEKPKGVAFIKRRVGNVFGAFGVNPNDFDPDDFVGKKVIALIKPDEDMDGFPTDRIARYKAFTA